MTAGFDALRDDGVAPGVDRGARFVIRADLPERVRVACVDARHHRGIGVAPEHVDDVGGARHRVELVAAAGEVEPDAKQPTPTGPSVAARTRASCSMTGIGANSETIPRPPAAVTAAASSGDDRPLLMTASWIGTRHPTRRVKAVSIREAHHMAKQSAALLVYRRRGAALEVVIVHPGGPYWAKKDDGAWSLPKGEYGEGEDPLTVARREFAEELGQPAPDGDVVDLGEVKQAGGKRVRCFAIAADVDVTEITSNEFEMEWPPRSGKRQLFPEVDRAAWVSVDVARVKLLGGQVPLLDRLLDLK